MKAKPVREVLPYCPYCGSKSFMAFAEGTFVFVECVQCRAKGPSALTYEEALKAYARRWDGGKVVQNEVKMLAEGRAYTPGNPPGFQAG